jgi:hypothetical protein
LEKPVRWTDYALRNLDDREIEKPDAEEALEEPEAVAAGHAGRQVFMRRYADDVLGREMLLRVVFEETPSEMVVVTAYKTSRFRKYLKGPGP